MKYFLDTEFHEHVYQIISNGSHTVNTIDLISIGIVREDGANYYAISSQFHVERAFGNDWLVDNVLGNIFEEIKFHEKAEFKLTDFRLSLQAGEVSGLTKTLEQIKNDVIEFVGNDDKPEFYAYYADYDWVVFCWLFGRMIDLPSSFPKYCRDLKQILDEKYLVADIRVDGATLDWWLDSLKHHPDYPKQENEHNALADAKWNKSLFEFLSNSFDIATATFGSERESNSDIA